MQLLRRAHQAPGIDNGEKCLKGGDVHAKDFQFDFFEFLPKNKSFSRIFILWQPAMALFIGKTGDYMFRDVNGLAPREDFIFAMRQVASSVTVVTTDGPAGQHGATVSAFSSVSADPPTVLICLSEESRIARTVRENGHFCVNVLREDGAEIADRFAGLHDDAVNDRFSGIDIDRATGGSPSILGATAFQCDLQRTVRSGSHLIVIGHVKDVRDGQAPPLAYREGSYHRVVPQGLASY